MNALKNITRTVKVRRFAALLAATGLMAGCWDVGGPEIPNAPVAAAPVVGASIPGFTVAVTDANSPINGAKVDVPENAVAGSETVTIAYQDALPGALSTEATALGAQQLSKVLIIERTGKADFGKTVDVTIPFDKTALPADATPIVAYWDEDTQSYSPIAIRSIDRVDGKIVFMTAHASKYVVIWINPSSGGVIDPSKLGVNAGFDPALDSFFVHNFGSYDVPGGNGFGMAGYAAWYHHAKKALKGAGLRSLYKEGNPALEEDDQTARELISRAYQAGNQKAHIAALDAAAAQGATVAQQTTVALTIIQQLIVTKQAQLLAVGKKDTNGKWTDGHTVTVYAFDSTTQKFLFYDPSYPGEVISVPWAQATGFGTDSKSKAYDVYAFASFNSAYSSKTLQSLYDAAEAGFPTSLYPKIAITAPAELGTNSNTFEVAADAAVAIKGTVPRPANADNPNAQRYAHVYLNGVYQPTVYPLDQGTNAFEVPIAKLPSAAGTDVMILISETAVSYAGWGSGAAWAGGFHAFKQFRLRVANQYFFQNLGFETGDLTGWISERHTWQAPTPQLTPSDKSAVLSGPGFDPIATDLQVPLFGSKVARINNSDSGYHISTLTQSAVVPNNKNPGLRFYWSAVLQDPNHPPQDQPYVEIVVTNKTKGTELYRKRYFSDDPAYSGWLSYQNGQWKSIPWQLVELSLADAIGDTIELKVEAADCAQGAHGGYAYLDVEE